MIVPLKDLERFPTKYNSFLIYTEDGANACSILREFQLCYTILLAPTRELAFQIDNVFNILGVNIDRCVLESVKRDIKDLYHTAKLLYNFSHIN